MVVNKEDEHIVAEICAEVMHLMQAIKHSEALEQMEEHKEEIYNRVDHKIDTDERLAHFQKGRKRLRFTCVAAACIALLCMVAAYQVGLRSTRKIAGQTQVELSVPYGILSKVILSDGTSVTLNGGSKLTYPASFGLERQVSLSGEGFFDVTKDESHPFVVNAKNLSVKVQGTRFALKAYEEDRHSILTLEEGSVEAIPVNEYLKKGRVLLKPDQQLILDNQTGKLQRKNVSAYEYTSWKDEILHFRDMTLDEVAVVLERRFNVKINILSEEIRTEHYVARFKYGENVEQILDKLAYKRSWKYVKQQGAIEIKKK